MKHIFYAPVAIPDSYDCALDSLNTSDIKQLAQDFIEKDGENIDFNHCTGNDGPCWMIGKALKNIILPHDLTVKSLKGDDLFLKKGSWVLKMAVNKEADTKIKNGEFEGVSLRAIRNEDTVEKAEGKYTLLGDDFVIDKVSFVKHPCVHEAVFLDNHDFEEKISHDGDNVNDSRTFFEKIKDLAVEALNSFDVVEKEAEITEEIREEPAEEVKEPIKEVVEEVEEEVDKKDFVEKVEIDKILEQVNETIQKLNKIEKELGNNLSVEKSNTQKLINDMRKEVDGLKEDFANFKKNKTNSKSLSVEKSTKEEDLDVIPDRDVWGCKIRD